VIHAHWWFPAGLAAPPELPLVVTLHGTDGRLLAGGGLGRRLGRRVLKRAAVVTTVSRALAHTVEAATGVAVPPEAIQGLPLEMGRFRPTTGGGGVVAVARLTAQKRLHLLVEAIAVLARQGREVPLTIAGDGPEAGRLEALIGQLELTRLARLTAPLTPEAVAALLAKADSIVLPALAEGYGMAAAEALASGVPLVVCTDGGGLVELAAAGAGSQVVAADPAALAGAITALLNDPAARPAATAAGHQLRRSLSPEAAASKAIGWYRQAIALRG
jgi:glycosyltransferase involved in cell wall biosynthesis